LHQPSNAILIVAIVSLGLAFFLDIIQRKSGDSTLCLRHWLEILNSCEALMAAVPGSSCEEGIQGRDLPAYRQSDKKVFSPIGDIHSFFQCRACRF